MARSGFEPALDQSIECSPRAPAEARRAVEVLGPDVAETLIRDVQLIVSELVTNSVRHSGSNEPIRVRAWIRAAGVRVEIADAGIGFEPDASATGDRYEEGGRGLLILDSLAERWGVQHDTRARVWFEVSPRPQSAGLTNAAS